MDEVKDKIYEGDEPFIRLSAIIAKLDREIVLRKLSNSKYRGKTDKVANIIQINNNAALAELYRLRDLFIEEGGEGYVPF